MPELWNQALKSAIFICGPTAVGKTRMAIEIAKWLDTDIISYDSRQFFKELKIGAAFPNKEELKRVKHHLIGQLSVTDDFNAGNFERQALKLLETLFQKNDNVVLVGGSGLYMKALTEGIDDLPKINPKIREKLKKVFKDLGIEVLQNELREKDPNYLEIVDKQNSQRLIRALEVIYSTNRPFSKLRKGRMVKRNFNIVKIGLKMPRPQLYERINSRVDKMMEAGLLKEAQDLNCYRAKNPLQTVGYKELFQYFDDKYQLPMAVSEIKKNSRRYAKRQLTWLRRDKEIQWFNPMDLEKIKNYLESYR